MKLHSTVDTSLKCQNIMHVQVSNFRDKIKKMYLDLNINFSVSNSENVMIPAFALYSAMNID
jgi:hypothetical protein